MDTVTPTLATVIPNIIQQTTNTSVPILRNLNVSNLGIAFVLAFNSAVFLLALLIFFICFKRTALYKAQKRKSEQSVEEAKNSGSVREESTGSKGFIRRVFDRFYQWFFLVKEYENFGALYGQDTAVYLWFSKNMFLAFLLCTIIGLSVLLPLHLTGRPPKDPISFAYGNFNYSNADFFFIHTTVAMVQTEYSKLWAHVALTIVFSGLFIFFLRRFHSAQFVQRGSSQFHDTSESIHGRVSNFTVEVTGLDISLTDNEKLRAAFEELYPKQIYSARIVMDTSHKIILQRRLDDIERKIRHIEAYIEKYGKRPKMWLCCRGAGFCKSRTDELSYYEARREDLQQKLQDWKLRDMQGTGHAFVIFKSTQAATQCAKAAGNGKRFLRSQGLQFRARRAAEPDDLNWENFQVTPSDRNLRIFIVHVLLVVLLLFFSSPLSILSAITTWVNKVEWLNKIFRDMGANSAFGSDFVLQYLPTLILWTVSNCLPYALYYLSRVERYKSKSDMNRVNLIRLYVYLCLATLILPSLLQVSVNSIVQYTIKNDVTDIFSNLFLPAAAVFFVCYALQYVLLGNTIDVLKLVPFLKYVVRSTKAITQEEKEEALQVTEFETGFEFSFLISFFAINIVYSVFSPVMIALGLAYSISKYVIDRHNITILCDKNTKAAHKEARDLWAYREKTKVVTILVLTSILIFQCFMVIFFARNGQPTYMHTFVLFVLLIVTFIYTVTWGVQFQTDETLTKDVNVPLMQEVYGSDEEEDMISLHFLPRFKYSYLPPYALESYPELRKQVEDEANGITRDDTTFTDPDTLTVEPTIVSELTVEPQPTEPVLQEEPEPLLVLPHEQI